MIARRGDRRRVQGVLWRQGGVRTRGPAERGDRGRVQWVLGRPVGVVGVAAGDPGGTSAVNVPAAPWTVGPRMARTAAAGPVPTR